MNDLRKKLAAITILAAGALVAWSCTDEKKETPDPLEAKAGSSQTSSSVLNGSEAGGTEENTITVSARVAAVDQATRQLTLVGEDGTKATFVASPEIKNFNQIYVGDKVTATVKEKLTVFATRDGAPPTVSQEGAMTTAAKGAKPGMMVGQTYEIVATCKAIDRDRRVATLQFSDGSTRDVRVRPDVDLSKYKVGDNLVIRGSESLSLVVEKP